MSILHHPDPVKLVMSLISAESGRIAQVIDSLSASHGITDYISTFMTFEYTDYYTGEMGTGLKRRVIAFESLVQPGRLPDIKKSTNDLEAVLSRKGKRYVNIDPGYISAGHLLLATGKPYAHRPYLGGGVYGDLALIYRGRSFQAMAWTYPDYREPSMISVLTRMREKYLKQLAALKRRSQETE